MKNKEQIEQQLNHVRLEYRKARNLHDNWKKGEDEEFLIESYKREMSQYIDRGFELLWVLGRLDDNRDTIISHLMSDD